MVSVRLDRDAREGAAVKTRDSWTLTLMLFAMPVFTGCYAATMEGRPCDLDGGCLPEFVCDVGVCQGVTALLRFAPSSVTLSVGKSASFNAEAAPPDCSRYWVSSGLPAGLSIHSVTGVISGIPSTESPARSYGIIAACGSNYAEGFVTITVVR
jgi:hypothetical protein